MVKCYTIVKNDGHYTHLNQHTYSEPVNLPIKNLQLVKSRNIYEAVIYTEFLPEVHYQLLKLILDDLIQKGPFKMDIPCNDNGSQDWDKCIFIKKIGARYLTICESDFKRDNPNWYVRKCPPYEIKTKERSFTSITYLTQEELLTSPVLQLRLAGISLEEVDKYINLGAYKECLYRTKNRLKEARGALRMLIIKQNELGLSEIQLTELIQAQTLTRIIDATLVNLHEKKIIPYIDALQQTLKVPNEST